MAHHILKPPSLKPCQTTTPVQLGSTCTACVAVSRQCNKQLSACAQLEYWCASEVTRADTASHRLHVCRTENSWTFSSYTRRHTDTHLTLRKIELASAFITISVLLAGSQYWRQDLHTAVTCCVSGYRLPSWTLTTLTL